MKRIVALVFFVAQSACGGAARPPTVAIPLLPRVPTLEQRKADVCARTELVALGNQVLGSAQKANDTDVVRRVTVRDAANVEVNGLKEEVTAPIKVGAPFDAERGREAARRLWQTGSFDDVAIETQPEDKGIAVVLRVTPKRKIANVFVSGDAEADALHVAPGSVYDAVALTSAKRAVLDLEHKSGHLDATLTVSSAFADLDRRGVDVCVTLARGPRVAIDQVKVHGSAFDAILASVLAREDKTNVAGSVVDEDLLARDELVLAAELYDHGLLENKVKRSATRHGDAITIDFEITDGPVYRYSTLDVRGDLLLPKRDYMKIITVKRGDVFNRTVMLAIIENIRAAHRTAGRADIEVEPSTELDAAKGMVAVSVVLADAQKHGPPGFAIVEMARGQGRVAAKGDTVSLHYKGTLTNGTVFDDSHKRAPFEFEVGAGRVIKGFDRGVTGMRVGGKRRVTIPPDMGYGPQAMGNIPASSTLVFEIELLSIR